MKKTLRVLLVVYAIVLFIPMFSQNNISCFEDKVYAEKSANHYISIQISQDINAKNSQDVLNHIKNVMDEYHSDIFFTKRNGDSFYKFVYTTTNQYSLFDSYEYGEDIPLFTSNQNLNIYPIDNLSNEFSFSGEANIICEKEQEELIVHSLKSKIDVDVSIVNNTSSSMDYSVFVFLTILSFTILLAIIIVYDQFKKYKLFSIKKLNGFSYLRIWWDEISVILFNQFFILLSVITLCTLLMTQQITSDTIAFLIEGYKLTFVCTTIIVIISSLVNVQFSKIKIVDYIKGKHVSKWFMVFNQFVLFMLIVISIVLCFSGSQYANSVISKISNYNQWVATKEYYIIPTIQQPNNVSDITNKDILKRTKQLFIELSSQGSIYADFNEFIDDGSIVEGFYYESRFGYINNEYLRINNVVNSDGKVIQIDENESKQVLLIPDNKKYDEKFLEKDVKSLGYEGNDDVVFYYYKSNQLFFTYNSKVVNNYSNSLKDIVLSVRTANNGDLIDYDRIMGYKNNPFKIKADNQEEIQKILKKFLLDDYYMGAVTAYDDMAQLQNNEMFLLAGLSATFIIMIVLITKSISHGLYSFISRNQKLIAVKRTNGFTYNRIYQSYIYDNLTMFIVLDCVFIIFKYDFLMVQCIVFLLALYWYCIFRFRIFYSKKNYISLILKGENL